MKYRHLIVVFSLIQTQALAGSVETPSWVIGLRSGKEAMVIDRGKEFYFRRQLRDSDLSESDLCEKAEKMAFSDIEKVYPNASTIPYRLEVKFYDEDLDECSITIAIDKSIKRLNSDLEKLRKENEEEKKSLEKELQETRRENAQVEREKRALLKRLEDNKTLRFYVEQVESAAEAFGNKVGREAHRAEQLAFNGAYHRDFMKALGVYRPIQFSGDRPCERLRGVYGHTSHGHIDICWSDRREYEATIISFCNANTRQCWHKDP